MLDRPDTLLIGSAARKAGKTSFAARIIRRCADRREVVGVKLTPLPEPGEPLDGAPRFPVSEGEPCEPFLIDEERTPSQETDTGRMRLAGAQKVYWLRARRDRLEAAAAELWARIPAGTCVVAEGGSLRRTLKPGLFVLLRGADAADVKDSFLELLPSADRVGHFDGRDGDLSPESCRFIDGVWCLRPPASAVVLAGGDSRRMGRDKALLDVEGRPLIARIVDRLEDLFDEIVIGAARSGDYGVLGRTVIADREPGQGPLMGLASCLERISNDLALVMACDIPRPDLRFAASLLDQAEGYDMVLPRSGDSLHEPLFAVYRRSVLPAAWSLLAAGERSILKLLDRVRVRSVPLPAEVRLDNINTLDDYLALSRRRT